MSLYILTTVIPEMTFGTIVCEFDYILNGLADGSSFTYTDSTEIPATWLEFANDNSSCDTDYINFSKGIPDSADYRCSDLINI